MGVTMHDDDGSVFAGIRAGAYGYLVKGAAQEDVAWAIAAVSRGEAIFGPAVAGRLLQFFAAGPESVSLPFPQLTTREREIFDLMAGGLGNAEIGQRLFLRPKTVSNNVSVIFGKLQVAGRPKAQPSRPTHSHMLLLPERCRPEQPRILVRLRCTASSWDPRAFLPVIISRNSRPAVRGKQHADAVVWTMTPSSIDDGGTGGRWPPMAKKRPRAIVTYGSIAMESTICSNSSRTSAGASTR
jgi:hypothetical protein